MGIFKESPKTEQSFPFLFSKIPWKIIQQAKKENLPFTKYNPKQSVNKDNEYTQKNKHKHFKRALSLESSLSIMGSLILLKTHVCFSVYILGILSLHLNFNTFQTSILILLLFSAYMCFSFFVCFILVNHLTLNTFLSWG